MKADTTAAGADESGLNAFNLPFSSSECIDK